MVTDQRVQKECNTLFKLGYDVIAQRPVLRAERLPWVTDVGRELNDDLIRIVREWVMHQFSFEPKREDLSDVLLTMATKNRFNPIVDNLDALKWDGVGRVDSLFPVYFGAASGAYECAVGRNLMVAATFPYCVGRIDHTWKKGDLNCYLYVW